MTTHSPVAQMPLTLGQQILFAGDQHRWTVQATSEQAGV